MPENNSLERSQKQFQKQIGKAEQRRLAAQKNRDRSIWFGLGAFGVIGWSVVTPTLVGVAIGWWVDRAYPSHYSWTLMLMFCGLAIGCVTAWQWITTESQRDDSKK
ncbi:MAG: AtpZ/AtpI family protein [Planctomycetaceae bacterium]|nr:AtpZ/AtpI family protein [Planctomycetaceae bacterium]